MEWDQKIISKTFWMFKWKVFLKFILDSTFLIQLIFFFDIFIQTKEIIISLFYCNFTLIFIITTASMAARVRSLNLSAPSLNLRNHISPHSLHSEYFLIVPVLIFLAFATISQENLVNTPVAGMCREDQYNF